MPARTIQPVETPDLEDAVRRAGQDLALLQRWAEAESYADRGGMDPDLERDAWRAAERMLADARAAMERMNAEVEVGTAAPKAGAR